MTRVASGTNVVLKRVTESSFGNMPNNPEIFQQRFSTYSPSYTKEEVVDPTITGNRQQKGQIFTTREMSMSLEAVLSHEDQEPLLASGLWGDWKEIDDTRVLKPSRPAKATSFTFEADQKDIDTQRLFTGLTVNSFTITSPLDGAVTVSYDLVGKEEKKATSTIGDTVTEFSDNKPFTHIDGELSISFLAPENCIVQSYEISVTNNASASFCWGDKHASSVDEETLEVTGSVSLFYTGPELTHAYLDDEEGSLSVTLKDQNGNKFSIETPRIVLTDVDTPFDQGKRVVTLPFRALAPFDSSEDVISITAIDFNDGGTPDETSN